MSKRKGWTAKKDAALLDGVAGNKDLAELAKQLTRRPGELQSRLDRLGVTKARIPRVRALEILAERKKK